MHMLNLLDTFSVGVTNMINLSKYIINIVTSREYSSDIKINWRLLSWSKKYSSSRTIPKKIETFAILQDTLH